MWMIGILSQKKRTISEFVAYSDLSGAEACSISNPVTLYYDGARFFSSPTGSDIAPDGYYSFIENTTAIRYVYLIIGGYASSFDEC